MSMPKFPDVQNLTVEDSIAQIISSIAMEELSLSHILNAEGEKLQYILGTLTNATSSCQSPTFEQMLEINESVKDMLSTVTRNQMFLFSKLSVALNAANKKTSEPDKVIGPDNCGKYYSPVGDTPNVFEIVDENGKPASQPPEYVYNKGGDPTTSGNCDAYHFNCFYYVKSGNIWEKVGKNGILIDSPALWAGPDGEPGTADDETVNKFSDNSYWVYVDQNVWQKVESPFALGELTGGGGSQDPTETPAIPIVEYGGKYYLGPLGPDSDENEYYYGDKVSGGNGKLMSTPDKMDSTDDKFYLVNGQMITQRPAKPITDNPESVDGRILGDSLTGDGDWVEIARNGDYSLIVRKTFINTFDKGTFMGNPERNGVNYNNYGVGTTAGVIYSDSQLRDVINSWFNPDLNAAGFYSYKLPAAARLRSFTVKNDAASDPGTQDDASSGLSKPQSVLDPTGLDVAFALSFGEAANFCSWTYYPGTTSSGHAQANFKKLEVYASFPSNQSGAFWLRTLGNHNLTNTNPQEGTTCSVDNTGYAFQSPTTSFGQQNRSDMCLVYPAMWVHQDVFDPNSNAPSPK